MASSGYKFWEITVPSSFIPTPQDWLAMKLIERHAGKLFYEHYKAIQDNEKKLDKLLKKEDVNADDKKALEEQIAVDKHLAHLWWIHNVRNAVVDNKEYTEWVFGLRNILPKKLSKWVDEKEWFLIASHVVSEHGPNLQDIQWELKKLQKSIDNI